MILMAVMGVLLLVGLILTVWWGGIGYRSFRSWSLVSPGGDAATEPGGERTAPRQAAVRYLRGVAVALVGGFWAGALVTGPAVRLVMRLLAVTAGDDAQGRLTEADEVVGDIDLDGTFGLYIFGGILPGLLSGVVYVTLRRLLPGGRLGGVAFGVLHLVVAATRIDPLRPGNPDFDIVGPGWLSVLTFSLAAIIHGMAVVAIANRYSTWLPIAERSRAGRIRAILPLVLPVLLLVPGVSLLVPLAIGLIAAVAASRIELVERAVRGRTALFIARAVVVVLALALLPGAVIDMADVVDRDAPALSEGDGE